jgi:hypothetical protein
MTNTPLPEYAGILHKILHVGDEDLHFSVGVPLTFVPVPGLGISLGDGAIEEEIEEVWWSADDAVFHMYAPCDSMEEDDPAAQLQGKETAIKYLTGIGWELVADPVETDESLEEGLQALDEGAANDGSA